MGFNQRVPVEESWKKCIPMGKFERLLAKEKICGQQREPVKRHEQSIYMVSNRNTTGNSWDPRSIQDCILHFFGNGKPPQEVSNSQLQREPYNTPHHETLRTKHEPGGKKTVLRSSKKPLLEHQACPPNFEFTLITD